MGCAFYLLPEDHSALIIMRGLPLGAVLDGSMFLLRHFAHISCF